MKKIIILFLLLLVIFSCKKKCSEEASTKSPLDATLDAYFGVYKKGNYWVYENQDKSKKDSIYVTAYDRGFGLESPPCRDIETLEFTLKAIGKDVVETDSLCIKAKEAEVENYGCPCIFFTGGGLRLHFYSDTVYSEQLIYHTSSITLNTKIFNGNILNIVGNDTLYIQSGIGIIGWKKNNDTYNLKNFYLQP